MSRSLINAARLTSHSKGLKGPPAYACRNPGWVRIINSFKIVFETFFIYPKSIPILTSDKHRAASLLSIIRLFIRSEEHTSELQSRENLVCRLLLEKNKTT